MRIEVLGLTVFERWFLRRICNRLMIQGGHQERITALYRIIREAAEQEFTENNTVTLNCFLAKCHRTAQKKVN